MRIYSFLPAATEIVFALGLGDQLCGVTDECDYPSEARNRPVVIRSTVRSSAMSQREIDERVVESMSHGGSLYQIDVAALEKAKPDLVITQELCDVCSVSLKDVVKTVNELSRHCKVISLKPRGLSGVLEDILTVGRACGVERRARSLVESLQLRIEAVRSLSSHLKRPRVFCVEWFSPVFASGHWVPEMVEVAGGVDKMGRRGEDSRRVAWTEVVAYDPQVLILIPCGFALDRAVGDLPQLGRLDGWSGLSAVREGRVFVADGSAYYSRPGPRLVVGLEMMAKMIHPDVFGASLPSGAALVGRDLLSATS